MEAGIISLFFIALGALLCPMLSSLLPNKIIPETVFLLIFGMVLGPNILNLIQTDDSIQLLSDLGLGFLFLLAGYEIKVSELAGKGGRHGLATWCMSFVLALAICIPLGIWRGNIPGGFAAAIVLTTTAFGTLVPILKDRGLDDTSVGKCVTEYGVWGELGPIIAIALLLSTRAKWITVLLLIAFVAISVAAAMLSRRTQKAGTKAYELLQTNAENNAQLTLRTTIFLLISLVALSALFHLDIVLGAFAAGFVLRAMLPKGDRSLEHKLNGIGYGFFIPLFFVVSGAKIDPRGVISEPQLLIIFIVTLLVVRTIPIFASLSMRNDTKSMPARARASVSLYCTTALPLIVAVASVATTSGAISQTVASVLIAAGGITVLVMPFLASVILHTIDAELGEAAKEIAESPHETMKVLKRHRNLERERNTKSKHVFRRNK